MRAQPYTTLATPRPESANLSNMTNTSNRNTTTEAPSGHAKQVEYGYGLLRQGRISDAAELGTRLATSHAVDEHAMIFAAEAALADGDTQAALERIDRAIAVSGGNPFLMLKKGELLKSLRRRSELTSLAKEVAARADGNGRLLIQLGVLYQRSNMHADAIDAFGKARALLGEQPALLYDMAVSRFFSGDFEHAERDLDAVLADAPQWARALYLRARLRRQTPESNHVAEIERRLAAGFRQVDDEVAALYALAKELEDLGEYQKSFSALASGAAKKRSTLRYDVTQECAAHQAIRDAYTAEAMAALTAGHDEAGAIFIVGMPRSGTTLTERMLVQSGEVAAAGEPKDFGNLLASAAHKVRGIEPALTPTQATLRIDFAALGRDYMRRMREIVDGSRWFVDKQPVNYRYCGAIATALPKARIIHLVRDPLDACYAVFKTLFFNAYDFSYELDELAEYYIAYHRTMRHWHDVMPGRILDVRYEDLVTDAENQTRRIYDWCGLEWSPEVMNASVEKIVFATASAAQVREPVHSRSIGSAGRFRDQLAPLAAKLAAAGIIDPV